jgi:hypothetical protein
MHRLVSLERRHPAGPPSGHPALDVKEGTSVMTSRAARQTAIAAALGALLLSPATAPAATHTFTTAGTHFFTVPAGVTSIYLTANGARGGVCYGATGGKGASVAAIIPVTPGDQLRAQVGGIGGGGDGVCPAAGGGAGGTGGGGAGGAGTPGGSAVGGAGGGGATVVSRGAGFSELLMVAGGGGGSTYQRNGGDAESAGMNGAVAGSGGGGATLVAGGVAGVSNGAGASAGVAGSSLTGGAGGTGDAAAIPAVGGGGGGGGGYFGGGGGGGGSRDLTGYSGAGGGGSSFISFAATFRETTTVTTSSAQVAITYPPPAPTATVISPAAGGTYSLGQAVTTTFSCSERAGGPGLASCADSLGTSTAIGGNGRLDTTTLGTKTYTVTATSTDGLIGTASATYTVVAPGAGGDGGGSTDGASNAPTATPFALKSVKALRGSLELKLAIPAAGTLQITTTSGRRISCKHKKTDVKSGATTVRVNLCAKATAALKTLSRKKRRTFTVTATLTAGGKADTVRATIKVPGRRKR